ncbi:peptidoglycan-binding protein LysM [Labrys sp. 22185]|uniref:peptidoglycan-binding protein LysM n=1 Tax=Labrys sp. 22185 TaxID=3453888 RepID=UPI003F850B23
MGLFNFIKDAGHKMFGSSKAEAAPAAPAAAAPTDIAALVKKQIEDAGLKAEGLNVSVDGDKVVLGGMAPSQEIAEKIILTAGNNNGVAQVDSQLGVNTPGTPSTMYTVVKGDTLWAIAEKHYGKGKGNLYKEIVKANTPPVKDPDHILPGWVLRIPPIGQA